MIFPLKEVKQIHIVKHNSHGFRVCSVVIIGSLKFKGIKNTKLQSDGHFNVKNQRT